MFICYKETGSDGRRTRDSVLANDLYHQLTQEGYKVFFARITLEDKLGQEYEPYIFAALNSAKVMVVIGTKPEYFNAVWVKNEWSRYLMLIKNGAKKTLIPAYRDMDPYDLPEEFSHLQAQDMGKLGFMQDLIRGIKKITEADKEKPVVNQTTVINNNAAMTGSVAPLLKRAFMFLEDSDWNSANEYAEKVLDLDPECAKAYFVKLLADYKLRTQEQLHFSNNSSPDGLFIRPIENNANYKKAVRFADANLKAELEKDSADNAEEYDHRRYEAAVKQMNDSLAEQNEQNMFATLFLGVLDTTSGELDYCNAGHNAPLIIRAEKAEVHTMDVQPNLPVGISLGYAYVEQKMHLTYGDTLFLYTDGLTEAENIRHEQFGEQRMEKALNASLALRPREIVDAMDAQVAAFVGGAEQSDDLTLMAVRYQKPAIIMRNDIQQIPTLAEWVDELGIPMELNMPINLALEEAVSNVMLYAYPGRNDGKVFVEFAKAKDEQGEKLIFTISDSGIPFDPTAKPEADITLSAEERAIGGLGIHLVRKLMDEIRYERQDEKNILTLVKILNSKS